MNVVKTAQHHEQSRLDAISRKLAAEKAAKQAEYDHYANNNSRHFDDDEMLAMCGLPPRRR